MPSGNESGSYIGGSSQNDISKNEFRSAKEGYYSSEVRKQDVQVADEKRGSSKLWYLLIVLIVCFIVGVIITLVIQ